MKKYLRQFLIFGIALGLSIFGGSMMYASAGCGSKDPNCGNPNGGCYRAWKDGCCKTIYHNGCDNENNNSCKYSDSPPGCSGGSGSGSGSGGGPPPPPPCKPKCKTKCGQSDGCGGKCSGPKTDGVCCNNERPGKSKFNYADCGVGCDGRNWGPVNAANNTCFTDSSCNSKSKALTTGGP